MLTANMPYKQLSQSVFSLFPLNVIYTTMPYMLSKVPKPGQTSHHHFLLKSQTYLIAFSLRAYAIFVVAKTKQNILQ